MGMSADPILFFGMVFENGHEFRPGDEDFDWYDFNQDEYPVEIMTIGHLEYSFPALAVKKSIVQHYCYFATVDASTIRKIGDMSPSSMTATLFDFAREHKLNIQPNAYCDVTGPDWILAANWG